MSFRQKLKINQALSDDGTPTGASNITGDYSSAEETFFIQAPANKSYEIHRIFVVVVGIGTLALKNFCVINELSSGLRLFVVSGATSSEMELTTYPIKHNGDLFGQFSRFQEIDFGPLVFNGVRAIAEVSVEGSPIILNGDFQERLELRCNDDFTLLDFHTWIVRGQVNDEFFQ